VRRALMLAIAARHSRYEHELASRLSQTQGAMRVGRMLEAVASTDFHLQLAYRPIQWAHGPRWSIQALDGERWFGFRAVRIVPGTDGEVLLVPLLGHTRGHCGVAVKSDSGWMLHAGDTCFTHHKVDLVAPFEPLGSRLFQRWRSVDNSARRDNVARLRQLRRVHPEVEVFCAHSSRARGSRL
jgi:glyoxylase-like metal-dependent hydrolase (beta-lactamase superfamily II)